MTTEELKSIADNGEIEITNRFIERNPEIFTARFFVCGIRCKMQADPDNDGWYAFETNDPLNLATLAKKGLSSDY